MVGAIEFLRKAKAIDDVIAKVQIEAALTTYLWLNELENEAEIVKMVMAYEIKESEVTS